MVRWTALACLGLALPNFALRNHHRKIHAFENTAVVRAVDSGGSLVHVTTTYAIKALEADSDIYTIALSPEEKQKTSWIQAKVKGQHQALEMWDASADHPDSYAHLLMVRLPKPMGINSTLNLVLETVQTHATYPWPETVAQDQDQSLKYEMPLFVSSPYKTIVQRTKFRAPTPRIHSYTTPINVDQFTLENPVTKSGATITYGPYNDVPPSSDKDFVKNHQMPIVVHYSYNQPVLEVTKLRRAAEISHWGANLNIQDEIHLHNAGPALKGQFSRLVFQTQNFYKQTPPHILPSLILQLPAGIRDAYIYDLIGNVSTSRLRTAPSFSGKNSVLEFRPRYPLMGGWNYSFTLGWDAPLADSLKWDGENDRYIAEIQIMTLIPGAVVDDAEVKIVLPEGATDIDAISAVSADSSMLSTHTTYLDTVGRPALIFKYNQLTHKHAGPIYVSYRLPFLAHLRKPVAVAMVFLGLFVLAITGRRIDLRIHKTA